MKTFVSAFVGALGLAIAATPAAAQADAAAFVDKDFGCTLFGPIVGVPALLITADSINVSTSGGQTQLTCHFDIPVGAEPAQSMRAEGFLCAVLERGAIAFTNDTRAVATPGGRAHLTCKINANNP